MAKRAIFAKKTKKPYGQSEKTENKDIKYSTSRYVCDATNGHWTLVEYYSRSCLRLKSKSGREEDYKQQTIQLAAHIKHCAITEEQGKT